MAQTADVVLIGGAGPEYSHLTLSWVYDWMAQGVPVVAMHRSTAMRVVHRSSSPVLLVKTAS